MALKAQAQFTNKYEQAFNQYRSSPFFNEEDWRRIAMGNDASNLDMYINALSLSKDINKEKFDEKYTTEFQDSDTRLAALYNEVYGSRVANDDRYAIDVYKYDEVGNMLYDEAGNPKTERKTISEYQYNKMIISQQNEARRQAHLKELAEEAKDPNAWGTAGALVVDVAFDGLIEFFNKTGALGKTLIDMARSDKTFANDWFTQWENNYKPVLDRIVVDGKSLSQHMLDFEKEFTHLRDTDGNLTGFGRIATGVATTAGEMLGSIITGGILAAPLGAASAGAGTVAKIATGATKVIRTAAYYAPLAAYGMGESYKEITANGNSIATSKMITNQLWKTGTEIAIEMALGKVFGTTGLDKMLFGRTGKVVKKTGKVGTLGGLAHFAGEALQEGTEEFLQEYSGFLVDSAYAKLVDESFKTEFSMQNLVDAAIIGAIISSASSITTISATKGKTILTADGPIKLGKIASAYYNASMPTFLQKLETAQKSLDDLISGIPSSEKIEGLIKRKTQIESELKSVNEQISKTTFFTPDVKKLSMAQELASDIGKGYALNQSLELVKNKQQVSQMPETLLQRRESLQRSLLEVDSQISQASKISATSEIIVSSEVKEEVGKSFRALYAAARAVQSFVSVIGEARMTKAAEILGRIEKMGNEGKFDKAEVSKARNEMIKELQLSGFSVDKGLIRRIKEAKMTKINQLVTKEDLGDDKIKWANFLKAVLEQTEAETIGITDGTNAVKNGKLVLVPEGELKLGAEQVTQDLAEQQLIENLVNGKYAGAPIERVLDLYKKLSGNNEATEYEAARHLLFDDRLALFKVLLFGNKKDIPLADNNMYRFLVALYEDYNLFLPKTILDEVTKTKLDNIKNKMTNAFIGYLKLQPYADYNVDFLNDAQKQAIKQHTESMAVFNRLVEGKATSSDIAFINKKINALQADKATKEGLYKMINSKEPTTIRSALFNIDTRYRIAFYGTNNGEIYMPVNSIRNRAFNMFLYNNNITIGNIVAEASNLKTMDEVKNYIHNLNIALNSFTSKRYSLRLRKAKTVNTESGQFKLNTEYRIEIIDNDSALKTKDLTKETLKAVATQKEKTVVYRGSKLTNVIASLVKDKRQAAYYSIDDLVVKPELLSEELQKEITDMYGELTSDSTYQYLRENLPKAVSGLTISLMADGTIGFVNVEAISELLIEDVSQFAITNGVKLEKFLKNPDRVPFLKDCIIELTTGNSDFNIRKLPNGKVQGVIKINANIKNDMTKLKTALAHEVQHAIQFANRLNTGNDGNIYSKLSKKDQESITKELTAQFPKVFEGAKVEDIPNLVNAVLYYASGEIAAHGAENSGVINFVPILIQDKDNITTITLPNGSNYSFKSDNAKNLMEVEAPLTDLVTNDPEKTVEEIENELEESKKASRAHQHKHGRTDRSEIRVKASKGTPLEPFAYQQLLVTVQDFIMRHKEYGDIDPILKRKIDNGTLRKKDIDFYLRNTPGNLPTDAATFKLINEIFYQNEYITSFEQLDEYVEQRSAHYYAIRALFRATDQAEQLIEKGGPKLYDVFMQLLENDLELKKKFDRIVRDYWEINYKLSRGSKQTVAEEKLEAAREQQVEKSRPVNARYLRFLWLSYFDGSVNAGAEAAAVARCMAYAGRDIANVDGSTLPEKAKVKIKPTKDDWELFTKVITDDVRGVLVSAAQQGVTEEAIAEVKAGKKLTMEDLEARKTAITNEILYSQLNNPERFWEIWNKYMLESQDEANIRFAQELVKTALGLDIESGSEALNSKQEAKNTEINDIIRNELKGKVRNKAAVMRNVRSILSTIQDKLSRRPAIATNNFLKHMDDLLDEKLKLKDSAIHLEQKQSGTRLKDLSILLEYEERLRKASKDITLGIYDDSRYTSKLRAERKATDNLIRKLENAITGSEQTIGTGIKIGDETLHIDAERELPLTIKRLLETEIKRTAKSTTQLFTNDDERHIKMNYKNFITDHAEMLNALTQDQVNEIIEFYKTSGIVADTNRFRAYITIQQLLLGYIYDGNGKATCNFTLNSEQIEFIESRMEFMARTGATMIATWKTVLTKLKLQDEKTKAMLTIAGIDLLPEDEKLLIDAINTGDVKQITSAKKEIYSKLVESYRGRKRTVFDRLLRFERMALLSGPGTWLRNEITNRTLAPLNNLSAILGNLFTKGERQKARRDRLKQYTLIGTQIEQKYADWIENEVIKSGLLEVIGSASIKYNFRATTTSVEDQLTKLIKDKIESELFDKESGANPLSRKLQEWITKAMSDDKAINKSFKRYLGKMLTEDKADISNGLTKEVMDTIADAYVFAAHDFMHKSNFWMKAENSFRTYLQKHYNPSTADGIYFMYKQVFPFAGASWNWFMEGLNYTPIGLIKGAINLIQLETKVNNLEQARAKGEKVVSSRFAEYMAKRQLGKGMIGSVTLIIGVLFAIAGKVGLDDEDDTYKLKFNTEDGPLYVDVSNFFGTSGFITGLSIAQSFRDSGGKFDYNSFMRCWSTALNTMFLDSSFAELYNTFRYTNSFGEYLAEMPMETAGMFVPNFIKTVGNTFKKYNVTYSAGFRGQLERFMVQSFAPFSYTMPYAINPYTGDPEIINEGWFGLNLVNRYTPLKIKNYEFGDAERIAVSLGVKKGNLPGLYKVKDSTIVLSSSEVELLNQFYGKLNSKDLEEFLLNRIKYTVENEEGEREELTYRKMTDKQKAAVIERIMSNNSGMAKIYILTSSGQYKYYANDSEYAKLKAAGITKNVYRKVGKNEGFVKT